MKTVKELNITAKSILKTDKSLKNRIQVFLKDFIESFESPVGLNKNSTPLHTLLEGLNQKDKMLISAFIKEHTNAKVALNKDKKIILKIQGDSLVIEDSFYNNYWYDSAQKEKKEIENKFKSLNNALKALDKLFEKSLNTCENDNDKKILKDKLYNLLTTLKN